MRLEGLKINFLGDSITEGHGVADIENVYWNVLKREKNVTVRGYGIGGTRYAKQFTPSENPRHDLDFVMRADEMDDDADIVVVFGGTNDFGHGDAPIGMPADRTNETFWGACHVLYEKLINKYPEAVIVIMTPLHRTEEDNPCGSRKLYPVATLSEYVKIIKTAAEYYSLPVLDLWSVSGIQPNVPIIKEKYCPDGLHPNDAGQRLIANRLIGFLESL